MPCGETDPLGPDRLQHTVQRYHVALGLQDVLGQPLMGEFVDIPAGSRSRSRAMTTG